MLCIKNNADLTAEAAFHNNRHSRDRDISRCIVDFK